MLNTSTYLYIAFYLIYGSNIAVTIDLPWGKGCEDSRDLRVTITNGNNKLFTLRYWYDIVLFCKKKIHVSWKKNNN